MAHENRNRWRIVGIIAAVLPLCGGQPLFAKGPCDADIERFCKDVQRGGGRLVECLAAHNSELSEACKSKLEERATRRRQRTGPCSADAQQFCKDVQAGAGRIQACLQQHQQQLSEACKNHLVERAAKRRGTAGPCQADVQQFCKDVQRGGGRIQQCLRAHEGQLSESCRKHLAERPPPRRPLPTNSIGATPAN